LTPPILKSI